MNETSPPPTQSEALLREIEQQTMDEARTIAEGAEREAGAIVAQAYASACRRMHDAVEELRSERGRRVARARAEQETDARMRSRQHAADAIRQAWPFLEEALDARWIEPAARLAWVEGVARHARDRLMPGTWTVEHPAAWSADEQRRFRQSLGVERVEVAFEANREITAGLRILAGQATLDATSKGLLADRAAIEALLLAEIESGRRANDSVAGDE